MMSMSMSFSLTGSTFASFDSRRPATTRLCRISCQGKGARSQGDSSSGRSQGDSQSILVLIEAASLSAYASDLRQLPLTAQEAQDLAFSKGLSPDVKEFLRKVLPVLQACIWLAGSYTEKSSVIAGKDATIAGKDATIAAKDAVIASEAKIQEAQLEKFSVEKTRLLSDLLATRSRSNARALMEQLVLELVVDNKLSSKLNMRDKLSHLMKAKKPNQALKSFQTCMAQEGLKEDDMAEYVYQIYHLLSATLHSSRTSPELQREGVALKLAQMGLTHQQCRILQCLASSMSIKLEISYDDHLTD